MYLTLFQSTDFNNQCNCVWFFSAFAKNRAEKNSKPKSQIHQSGSKSSKNSWGWRVNHTEAKAKRWRNRDKTAKSNGTEVCLESQQKGHKLALLWNEWGGQEESVPWILAAHELDSEKTVRSRTSRLRPRGKITVEEIGFTPLPFDGQWWKEASVQEHVPVLSGDRRVVCAQLGAEKSNKREWSKWKQIREEADCCPSVGTTAACVFCSQSFCGSYPRWVPFLCFVYLTFHLLVELNQIHHDSAPAGVIGWM